MNLWFGGFGGEFDIEGLPQLASPPWRAYRQLADLADPGPTMTSLFWDQREDTINMANYFIDMTGYPNQPQLAQWVADMPGSYHNRAGGLSFADGHSEIRRWVDPRTLLPLQKDQVMTFDNETLKQPNNRDIFWMQERATRRLTP